MAKLNGSWNYMSFRSGDGSPSLVPWAPLGRLTVTTGPDGTVEGALTFPSVPGLTLVVHGTVTPAVAGKLPEGVDLTGEGGSASINRLRGYAIPGSPSPVIVGEVVAEQNDPAGQPNGTRGPFVLFRSGD